MTPLEIKVQSMQEQRVYAVDFQVSGFTGLLWLDKPTVVESWEGDFLTGIFPVFEGGYMIALGEGQVRFAKITKVHKVKTDKGFVVEFEKLKNPFRKGEPRT